MSKLIPIVLLLACPAFSGTLIDTSQGPVSFTVGATQSSASITFLSEAWQRLAESVNLPATTIQDLATAAEETLLDRLLRVSLLYPSDPA